MNDRSPRAALTLSIAAVERDTGLTKDTLRVWERRYGFPTPERDPAGERAYPLDQVERLRLVKRLLDVGHRPGRVVALELDDLQHLADACGADVAARCTAANADGGPVDECLALVVRHDLDGLRDRLRRDLMRLGLPAFVMERALPLTRAIGDAWLRGQLQVFEEHACTEVLQSVMRGALSALQAVAPAGAPSTGPRVLLTTLPGEPHALALLLAEALLTVDGATCIALGPQTPVRDVALAAAAYRSDVVVLAFSGIVSASGVVDAVSALRAALPAETALWVGGNAPALYRRSVVGVRLLSALPDLRPAVADWLTRRP